MRSPSPRRWMPSARPKARAVRCTAFPCLIKDNIDTADRMMTTAGSLALLGSIAARDSVVAQRLRAAGAVILGKTNLSEWANFRSSHSTSGWSGRGGLTRNPYALDRNAVRLQFRIGRGGLGQPVRAGHRHGDRWLDRLPVFDEWHRRHQADAGSDPGHRHHSHRAFAGHRRTDGAHRHGCGDSAGRA